MKAISLLLFLLLFAASVTGQSNTFTDLGEAVLSDTLRFHPVHATYKGIHDHDTLLGVAGGLDMA